AVERLTCLAIGEHGADIPIRALVDHEVPPPGAEDIQPEDLLARSCDLEQILEGQSESRSTTRSASSAKTGATPLTRAYAGSSGIDASSSTSRSSDRSGATGGKTSIVSPQCGQWRPRMFSTAPKTGT